LFSVLAHGVAPQKRFSTSISTGSRAMDVGERGDSLYVVKAEQSYFRDTQKA